MLHLNSNYFILTGAMGTGKSTVLQALYRIGYKIIQEPARQIITEQRAIDGDGIYDRDPKLFYNLMLSRALFEYEQNKVANEMIVGDRGVADNIIYAEWFQLDPIAAENAAKLYRYNPKIFFFPAWEEIYANDNERKMSFSDAKAFGDRVKAVYLNLNYTLIEVPFSSVTERVNFIVERINKMKYGC